MTQFEDVLETVLEEYARRDSEGEFDTWEETDAFVKEKAEVLLAYAKEEPVSKELKVELENYIKDHFTIDTEQLDRFGIEEKDYMYSMDKSDMIALVEHFINWHKTKEEPVSDNLDDAAFDYAESCKYDGVEKLLCVEHFKAGAEWKERQFEKNRLKHCNSITNEQAELEQGFIDQHLDKYRRMPTFLDAIEYGMTLQKEQMMKDAIKRTVKVDAGGFPYIDATELYDYIEDKPLAKDGEKVKLIIVKED